MNADPATTHISELLQAAPVLARVEQIEQRVTTLETEERAIGGLLPPEEVADRFLGEVRRRVRAFEVGPAYPGDFTPYAMDLVHVFSCDPPRVFRFKDTDHVFALLGWILGPAIEAGIPTAFARLAYTPGPSSQARRAQREALAAERATLIAEHEVRIDQLNAIGDGRFTMQHLPAAAERRAVARSEAEREARGREMRREEEERLNRAAWLNAGRRGGQPSPYLQANGPRDLPR